MNEALLLVGHGSRDLEANTELALLFEAYQRPRFTIAHAFVELADPPLDRALDELATSAEHVIVLPLALFAAGHIKNDIPLALATARKRHPRVRFTAAPALGVHPSLVELAFERARPLLIDPPSTAAIILGRGSSDPDANGDFFKVARLLFERMNVAWCAPAFAGIARPLFAETAEMIARARPKHLLVVPYLLSAGRLYENLEKNLAAFAAQHPWIECRLAPHLGIDDRIHSVLDARLAEAIDGDRPLACDHCQYRIPIAPLADHVGGLRALLWSLRHRFTHSQAMPHQHAHRPLEKHVFVCCNTDCADRGSVRVVTELRRQIKEAGRERDIRVTRTYCMGRCGEGPAVAVYPDGIWYRNVGENDAAELVREHLLGDRLVARLIDQIMQ